MPDQKRELLVMDVIQNISKLDHPPLGPFVVKISAAMAILLVTGMGSSSDVPRTVSVSTCRCHSSRMFKMFDCYLNCQI